MLKLPSSKLRGDHHPGGPQVVETVFEDPNEARRGCLMLWKDGESMVKPWGIHGESMFPLLVPMVWNGEHMELYIVYAYIMVHRCS